jgi:hypothetical protein
LGKAVGELRGEAFDQPRATARRIFGRLENETIARQKSRKYGPIQTRNGIVPRSDHADDPAGNEVYVPGLARKAERIEKNTAAALLVLDDTNPAAYGIEGT